MKIFEVEENEDFIDQLKDILSKIKTLGVQKMIEFSDINPIVKENYFKVLKEFLNQLNEIIKQSKKNSTARRLMRKIHTQMEKDRDWYRKQIIKSKGDDFHFYRGQSLARSDILHLLSDLRYLNSGK